MTMIVGGDNPHNSVSVDNLGRIQAHAASTSDQEVAAIDADAYNFNTSNITLTDALATPIFYFKNDSETRDIVISRIFVTFGASTGGAGEIFGSIVYNPTAGTLLSGTAKALQGFNVGEDKPLGVTSLIGASGLTVSGGTTPIEFLFPSASSRHLIGFQSIVVPRGGSIALLITPQPSNTSMVIQAGYNAFLTHAG